MFTMKIIISRFKIAPFRKAETCFQPSFGVLKGDSSDPLWILTRWTGFYIACQDRAVGRSDDLEAGGGWKPKSFGQNSKTNPRSFEINSFASISKVKSFAFYPNKSERQCSIPKVKSFAFYPNKSERQCPNVSTSPIMAMRCQQCFPLKPSLSAH